MGALLLLTCTLLCSWRWAEPHPTLSIRNISLLIEPGADVERDTNVTLRCRAVVIAGQEPSTRVYTISKEATQVYTKTTISSDDLVYMIPGARVSDSGKYKCEININGIGLVSEKQKLTVTGLSRPVVSLDKRIYREGEEVVATCTAPEETGFITYNFYADSKEIFEVPGNVNRVEAKLRFTSPGVRNIHCSYSVRLKLMSVTSDQSNSVMAHVEELAIKPVLEINPWQKVFEGDQLRISCTVVGASYNAQSVVLLLSQGTQMLSSGNTSINHSVIAKAKDSGTFECMLRMGNVLKYSTKILSFIELFSVPALTKSPAEVFPGDEIKLNCKSKNYASERLRSEEVTYAIELPQSRLTSGREPGVFLGRALPYAFNYTCSAQAKGIQKHSKPLLINPKVPASEPKIAVRGKVILGKPFQIHCQSDRGSLPINYTLWKKYEMLNTTTVRLPYYQALFHVTIHQPEEITQYMCEAQNNHPKDGELSKRLNATVIVPLSQPTLTVLPDVRNIVEGDKLYLICGINGTPPVTFKWYRTGRSEPMSVVTSNQVSEDHQIPSLGSEDSGSYYCEALNPAKNIVRSQLVTVEVRMALWKKAAIVAACLLVLALVVLATVRYFRARRGKNEAAAELSVKPSSPKSDDSLTVSLTPDTEVYNAATVKVDRATTSVWSERPPNAASDEESSVASNEADVEYTEVVHPQPVDPERVPLRRGTDTVYSELQNSPHGATHHDCGSVEYAELNGEQPDIHHNNQEMDYSHVLPVPVE